MEPRRRFRFLKELSEGNFGKVYMAEMITGEGFSSIVAIKLLHGKWLEHEEIVQRSRDEARLLGLLHHRNIVRVEDLTSINGQCAVIMEYLEGVDGKTLISWCKEHDRIFPRKAAFEICGQIVDALFAAYYKPPLQGGKPLELIHRDIKPSNCMVTGAGDVKLLDFGTARASFDEREAKTQALAFGSAAYMAPERLMGDPDQPAGDVFSLGITLYEMLSCGTFGKVHIRPQKFDQHLEKKIGELDLSDINDEEIAEQVRAVLRLLLAYEPGERPEAGTVVELMEALAEGLHDASLRRFAREVVSEALKTNRYVPAEEDPLTGSTLFEDISTLLANAEEAYDPNEATGVWAGGAEVQDPAAALGEVLEDAVGLAGSHATLARERTEEEPSPDAEGNATWDPAAAESAPASGRAEPTSEFPEDEPQRPPAKPLAPPPQSAAPTARPAAPSPIAPAPGVAAPAESHYEEPAKSGGMGKFIVMAALLLIVLGGGGLAAVVGLGLLGTKAATSTTEEPVETVDLSGAVSGGTQNVGEVGPENGTLSLTLTPPVAALVSIQSVGSDYKLEWDGTGTLQLVGVSGGTYKTKIKVEGGKTIRGTVEVTAGKSCAFTINAKDDDEWKSTGCE